MLPNPNAEAKESLFFLHTKQAVWLRAVSTVPTKPTGQSRSTEERIPNASSFGGRGGSPLSAAARRCCAHRQPPGLLHQTDTTARKRGTRRGGRRAAGRACSPRPPNTNITFGSSEDSAGPRFHFCLEQGRSQGLCCAPGMRMQLGGLPGGG